MNLRVTIGVCVKDSEKTIKESVDSIINQNYPAELIQLIIVDGNSKDKTLSIVNKATEKARLKVETYSDKGGGLAAARQIVVNKANGNYIIFADSDVKLFDDFTKEHVSFMEENPKVGVAFGRPIYQEGTLVSEVSNLLCCATGGFLGNDATIYRPEAINEVNGFDPNIKGASEDKDLINRIREKGWLISTNAKARFFHKTKEDFRAFWAEQSWFGYGNHYLSHKNKNGHLIWHELPIGNLKYGLRMAIKAYRLTHRKISFLILPQMILGKIGWWFGFIQGHIDGYGHEKNVCQDSKSAEFFL
jgi:glycosyltransferase involved in cell wall biosynthesis